MHNHDQEIIMALAEGRLTPTAASQAEAEIGACAECARDLELQRIALATLHDAPRVYLSATESAQIHDRLRRELAMPTPAPQRARTSPVWGRWVGLAAGAAAVFLATFLVLPNVLGGSSDDATETASSPASDEVADAATAETTTAALEAAPPNRQEVGGADDMMLAGDGAAEATQAPTTTTAAPETTAAPSSEDPSLDAANYFAYVHIGNLDEGLLAEILDQLSADKQAFRLGDENVKRIKPDWELCVAETLDLDAFPDGSVAQIVGIVVDDSGADEGMERLLVAFVAPNPADTALASVTIPECEVFEALP